MSEQVLLGTKYQIRLEELDHYPKLPPGNNTHINVNLTTSKVRV